MKNAEKAFVQILRNTKHYQNIYSKSEMSEDKSFREQKQKHFSKYASKINTYCERWTMFWFLIENV